MAIAAVTAVPLAIRPAYMAVAALARYDRYLGAAVFGSVACDTAADASDLDALVLVDEDNSCHNLSHPVIGGVKLDITFHSLVQLSQAPYAVSADGTRPPMLAGARVVFDKWGNLSALIARASAARPRPFMPAQHQKAQFSVYYADEKVRRAMPDPVAASLVMHTSLMDVLNTHSIIHERWRMSDKRLLADLGEWDPPLAALVERFVTAVDVPAKFALWVAIIEYVLAPIGGRWPIEAIVCRCDTCTTDLTALLTAVP